MHGNTLDDAGVVNQNIYLTHLLVNFLNQRLDVVFLGHVAHITLHVLDASLLVVSQTTLQGSLVDVVKDNCFDTCCNECLRNVEANAIRSACNPRILTFQ